MASRVGMAIDVERGADAHQRIDERRDGDAEGDGRRQSSTRWGGGGEGEGVHAGRADHRADDGVLDKRKVCCQESAGRGG